VQGNLENMSRKHQAMLGHCSDCSMTYGVVAAVFTSGVVYHYRPDSGRYTLSRVAARAACVASGGILASPAQLLVAFHDGMDRCDAGWLSDGSVR